MDKKFGIKTSGEKQEFGTGAHRDSQDGKGRFDLIPLDALMRVAKHYENGGKVYGDNNWKNGIPLARFLDSAMRHIVKMMADMEDEDHAAAACWNLMCFMWTKKAIKDGALPNDLDNLPKENI